MKIHIKPDVILLILCGSSYTFEGRNELTETISGKRGMLSIHFIKFYPAYIDDIYRYYYIFLISRVAFCQKLCMSTFSGASSNVVNPLTFAWVCMCVRVRKQ